MEEFNGYDIEPQNKKVHCYRCNRSFYDDEVDILFDNYICSHCIKQLLKIDVDSLIDMLNSSKVCEDDVYILLENLKQINKEFKNE